MELFLAMILIFSVFVYLGNLPSMVMGKVDHISNIPLSKKDAVKPFMPNVLSHQISKRNTGQKTMIFATV